MHFFFFAIFEIGEHITSQKQQASTLFFPVFWRYYFLFVYIMQLLVHSTLHLLFVFLWECSGEFMQFDLGCICADGCLSSSFSIPLVFWLRWLFSLLHCRSPLPFFLSLSMSQNKNNFQGRQRNRSRWQKIRMTAALAMWLIFQSFSLFSSW